MPRTRGSGDRTPRSTRRFVVKIGRLHVVEFRRSELANRLLLFERIHIGRLDPETFLGGKRTLNKEAARAAIQDLADQLDMDVLEAAEGILKIANESMAAAVRETTIERGQDPRDYYLIGFGGCGPMQAAKVADSLDISSVIIPSASGVLSAVGGTMMDIRNNDDKTFYIPSESVEPAELEAEFEELEQEIQTLFREEHVEPEDITMERIAEMRYVGQTYEVDVPVSDGELDDGEINRLVEEFHEQHEQEYGIASDQFPVTFVNLRLAGSKQTAGQTFQSPEKGGEQTKESGIRDVYFDGEWQETTIHHQASLVQGEDITGPAILEGSHSTITLDPGMNATIDGNENVRVTTTN